LRLKKEVAVIDVYQSLSFLSILQMKENQAQQMGALLNQHYFDLSRILKKHHLPVEQGGIPVMFVYRSPRLTSPTRIDLFKGKLLGIVLRLKHWADRIFSRPSMILFSLSLAVIILTMQPWVTFDSELSQLRQKYLILR